MQEIISKINSKLKDSGWYDALRIFIESSDFSDIIVELKRKVDEDKQRFCPALNTAFRFLEECPVDKIKAVILIDYSSNRYEEASGIPLSLPDDNSNRSLSPSSVPVCLFRSIDNNRYKYDVNAWVKQGILIVPLSLTSRIEGRSHKKLWSPLIMRIIEAVNRKNPNAPWLLMGDDCLKYQEDIVSPFVRHLELRNPVKDCDWSSWLNETFKSQNKPQIIW